MVYILKCISLGFLLALIAFPALAQPIPFEFINNTDKHTLSSHDPANIVVAPSLEEVATSSEEWVSGCSWLFCGGTCWEIRRPLISLITGEDTCIKITSRCRYNGPFYCQCMFWSDPNYTEEEVPCPAGEP